VYANAGVKEVARSKAEIVEGMFYLTKAFKN
jgi:hypothetical protein